MGNGMKFLRVFMVGSGGCYFMSWEAKGVSSYPNAEKSPSLYSKTMVEYSDMWSIQEEPCYLSCYHWEGWSRRKWTRSHFFQHSQQSFQSTSFTLHIYMVNIYIHHNSMGYVTFSKNFSHKKNGAGWHQKWHQFLLQLNWILDFCLVLEEQMERNASTPDQDFDLLAVFWDPFIGLYLRSWLLWASWLPVINCETLLCPSCKGYSESHINAFYNCKLT